MDDTTKNNLSNEPAATGGRVPQWERRTRRVLEQRMIDRGFGGETRAERRARRVLEKRMIEAGKQQRLEQREQKKAQAAAQAAKVQERKRQRELLKSQRVEILAAKPPECLTKKQQKRVMEARLAAAADGRQFHAASLSPQARRKPLVPETAEEREDWAQARELEKRMMAAHRAKTIPPR